MPNYRRVKVKGGTFFFTVVTYQRQKILCEESLRLAMRKGIRAAQERKPFSIDAWVLLPDHLHCIWTLPDNDGDTGGRWAMIKRYVTKMCQAEFSCDNWITNSRRQRGESSIWQRRFWERWIRDEADFSKHVDYIHYNPVKHGHVSRVRDWPYSTFHKYVKNGIYSKDWASGRVSEYNDDFGE